MRRTIPILVTLCAGWLHADVTIRYKTELKSSFQGFMQQAAPQLSSVPSEIKLRIKAAKSYLEAGGSASIGDATTRQLVLLDQDGKKYAITPADEYLRALKGALPAIPPEAAQMLAAFKTKSESRLTGRTEKIQGIEAEEHEVVLSMDGPPMPNLPPGPMLRVVLQIWTSKASELARVPALRELMGYYESSVATLNSNGGIKEILDMIPGLGESLGSAMQELASLRATSLRMHVDLFMPSMAAMMKQMPAGSSPFGADFDPNGPLMQVNQEMVELSTAAVPDSQFDIPTQYQKETVDEFLKTYLANKIRGAK